MKLAHLAMRNPVGTSLFAAVFVVLGLIAVSGLPVAYWPNITPPFLVVQTPYPGVSPEDIEEEVTKPIERVISTIDNIYEVESSSLEGVSQLIVRFEWGTDVKASKQDLREKLDAARGQLPRDIQPSSILALDALMPAPLEIAASSDRYDQGELRSLLEDKIVPQILRLPNAAAVDIRGGRQKVVRVEADPEKLIALNLPVERITQMLGAENVNVPAGKLTQSSRQYILRSFNKYQSLEDIRNVILDLRGATPILVGDVATVRLVDDEQIGIARVNGDPALAFSIRQSTDGNTVALVDETLRELEDIKAAWPDIKFQVIKDDSEFIKATINSVTTNVLFGAIIASLFIYLFLGSWRNTMIIVLSIPVSVLSTFLVMKSLGITLNTISLGGLALGVGMIVDASIVVLENLYYRQKLFTESGNVEGKKRIDLFADAVGEVALPITASIATSVVVFLPLAFTTGLAFFLLGELSLTVVAALIFSLIVSFTVIPALSLPLLQVDGGTRGISKLWQRFIDWLTRIYRPLIKITAGNTKRALATVVISFLLLIIPFLIAQHLDVEQLPRMNEGTIRVNVEFPIGTSLEATSNMVADIENRLMTFDQIETIYSVVGLTAFYNQQVPQIAWIDCRLPMGSGDADELMVRMREMLTGYPDADIEVLITTINAGMSTDGFDLRVVGPELETLTQISEQLIDSLSAHREVINLNSNMSQGKPEILITVDRAEAARWGLSPASIASTIRTAVDGVTATKYSSTEGDLYDVEVSLNRSVIRSFQDLRELPLQTPGGVVLPLRAVAGFSQRPGPAEIRRSDQERFLAVTGDAAPGIRQRDVRQIAENVKANIDLPPDYRWKEAGAARSIVESFRSLGVALVLAIFLVYVVMASQFNSFWQPIVISTAIPLSLIGAALGLLVFGGELNINSFLGVIMLAGIVVNNGILLVDYINRGRRDEGLERTEAIVQAGERRLRPILMTTLTTVSGMLFIALGLGTGGETLIPLSAVVIGGLTTSTLLTLFVVPAIYLVFDSLLSKRT